MSYTAHQRTIQFYLLFPHSFIQFKIVAVLIAFYFLSGVLSFTLRLIGNSRATPSEDLISSSRLV
jgi:hypothetical protein